MKLGEIEHREFWIDFCLIYSISTGHRSVVADNREMLITTSEYVEEVNIELQ